MSDRLFGLLDMAIVAVAVVALGIWQLVSVSREIARDKPPPDSPEGARHPVGEHRLDDR